MPEYSRPTSIRSTRERDRDRDEEGDTNGGDRTPTMSYSRPPSPRTSRTSTTRMTSRNMTVPGYGSTHNTNFNGLGLGIPQAPVGEVPHKDKALSSPRRISTSQHITRSPSLLNPPATSHQAYYSPQLRDKSLTENNHRPNQSISSQYPTSSSLTTPSSPVRHRRNFSSGSAIFTPVTNMIPLSPAGSVMRKIRHTASLAGLRVGPSGAYDAPAEESAGMLGDEDEGRRANGTRVWYRLADVTSRFI